MSESLYDERFTAGDSLIQSLDPRARLLAAALAALCFSCLQSLSAAGAALCLALLLPLAARSAPGPLVKRLALANCFILFIWLTVPLSMEGPSAFPLGPLRFSEPGLRLALLVSLKANAILLVFITLVAGIGPPRIGTALEALHVPGKLVFLLLFTYRYVHALGEEWQRLRISAQLRGFAARSNLHSYRTIANMLGLVFVNSFDRAQRIYEAMLLRGFNGVFHTTGLLKATRRDALFAALTLLALLTVGILEQY